ncbi:bifunctional enoyl-CoA hydratase/phosphate acetyltransferase [Fusibacter ferrireducens]|uniref:Bifunctional enoyl-CoA hydratase/phosphate acetyltransferase n=1 Tax=Fusibacter ferrireducens TaxID=2785058 RepID=A0ABR9ZZY1_9FIRM|nr:bifunctional enoyl-CoA hydratase/phosphate acetyltransferase [Fusibacter ferrireducens]MBF4696011.1 bifunctional enoyl-CoA hydratase/phosphate acetyltransferase [Fusibacter ferrireducens]
MIKSVKDLLAVAKQGKSMRLVVAAAQDEDVLSAVCKAAKEAIITPILVGDAEEIRQIAETHHLDVSDYEIIQVEDLKETAKVAVKLVSDGKADFLMKGLIDTSILLKAVLDKEIGLRTDSLLSHVMIYEPTHYHKLLFLTDGGMNIEPSYEEKVKITQNAITVCKAMGIETVKVAGIAAKEKVNEKMLATVDARKLQELSKTGHFGNDVIIEGPLALDLAVSKEAAITKRFESEIAGDVDVLLVPTIEVGNGIGKTLTYLAGADSAGIIMGAKVPIVLVSRADSYEAKLNSIALGSVIASYKG